jgi:glycosyltransferase involved in cell wall biosynthesis
MKKEKRLLMLTSTFPRWKDDEDPPFVFDLCNRLKTNYHIHVLAPHFPGSEIEADFDGIYVRRFRYFFNSLEKLAYHGGILAKLKKNPFLYGLLPSFVVGELLALVKLLGRYRFHLIHAHWLIPQGAVAVLACALTGSKIPLLCTSHGGDLFGLQGILMNSMKRWVILKSDALTVVSGSMTKAVKRLGADHKRVQVIPMGVDLKKKFVPATSKSNNNSLLFVGRLVEKKGLQYLIHALPLILKRHSHAYLQIAGDGPQKRKLKRECDKLGVSDHVCFLGALKNEDLPILYQTSDVVVFPSVIADDGDQEGLGLVLVEALGCECAIVATDLPAIQDIIVDGKTGLVVPQKNIRKLAEKINRLLEDQNLRRSLGREGRRWVVNRYDWNLVSRQYADLIESITRQPSTSSNRF